VNNKKIIFIDWDGTLCWSRFWESLLKSDLKFAAVVNDFFVSDKKIVIDWMRGKFKSEEINKIISEKTGLPLDMIWQTFVSDCKRMEVDPEIVILIKELRKKYSVILITGNMDCFTRFTVPALRLNEMFDYIVNSADVGYFKTDYNGKIFIDCLKQFNIDDISSAYLLEDSLKTCAMFNQLGGTAIKINDKKDTVNCLKNLLDN
jgi:FMN phosphatase YigB (HAD superfamily)